MADRNPTSSLPDYERLGLFYLGREVDPASGEVTPRPLLYDARDLTTHAVCVGMTGSGKTGLCLSLLEEAAIDGVPALAIDPKGDVGNLLLTFPELAPADFRPWIEEAEARREGVSVDELAARTAERWRSGLADWGQDPARIERLRASADFRIYTPGSDAGIPISILTSLSAPGAEVVADDDLFRDRVTTVASSLLGLLGRDADPLQSREHILVARVLEDAWRAGRGLDLAGLIRAVQEPPFERVGVLDLESFFPQKDRFALAMALNNLLASPGFAAWLQGEPLDPDRLLYTPEGRPRIAILSIAHLSEAERMFFVTLLLTETIAWMRRTSGSDSLRALLYMDEVFGYLPPIAVPPSKKPFLTLLKQARAYGLGLVLATQNPADLDYKALSNTGTWFLGRLQTERDRERVVEGLLGAAGGGLDRREIDRLLSGLGKRVFLLQNAHEPAPELFHTRWAMSYLAGPLTRQDVARLMAGAHPERSSGPVVPPAAATVPGGAAAPGRLAAEVGAGPGETGGGEEPARPPVLPSGVPVYYLPLQAQADGPVHYRPALLGLARVHYEDRKLEVEQADTLALVAEFTGGARAVEWDEAREIAVDEEELEKEPPAPAAAYEDPPQRALEKKAYTAWRRELADTLYRTRRLELLRSPLLDEVSRPGEPERDFRIRLAPRYREERDRRLDEIRASYEKKIDRLEAKVRRAEERHEREEAQAKQRKGDLLISAAATLGAALFGRSALGRAATTARGLGRVQKERGEAAAARGKLEALLDEQEELRDELEAELDQVRDHLADATDEPLDTVEVKPRKSDVKVDWVGLVWVAEG